MIIYQVLILIVGTFIAIFYSMNNYQSVTMGIIALIWIVNSMRQEIDLERLKYLIANSAKGDKQ